ncbi:hypothetical protein [Planctomyces sp. SH-PL14]|uniref:hypothetical protein n=1 Tax=Planctomyces sp. SH-PL14 TaxID=1632864 RepID=UPI0012E7FFFD|nr:hypothetical protein [Planctomyces sp. SH-PL14]
MTKTQTSTAPNTMSDNAAPVANPTSDSAFEPAEVKQFIAADTEAGTHITQMLSVLFLYTVLVMGLSTLITIYWVRSS